MRKLAVILITFLNVSVFYSQDLIYTMSASKNGQGTSLDSILFENLSNDTRLLFEGLPIQNSYTVNLTSQEIEGTTGISTISEGIQAFTLVENIPGEASIEFTDKHIGNINLAIYTLSGQIVYNRRINLYNNVNTISVQIPNSGVYILTIKSAIGNSSFKVIGAGNSGTFNYSLNNSKSKNTFRTLKSSTLERLSDFSFEQGDSLRITAYLDGHCTYPARLKINGSDSLNLLFVADDDNYVQINDVKYPINLGYNVWFSALDCGNFDVFAHGLYLTSDVTYDVYTSSGNRPGVSLLPSGKGNILIFNLFSKDSELTSGEYKFVDYVGCDGSISVGDTSYTMNPTDKFVTAFKEMNDPTSYALNVDLEIDWSNEDLDNPSDDAITKYTNYQNSIVRIISGIIKVEKNDNFYTITFDCEDFNGLTITGKYTGELRFLEFGI